MNSLSTMPDVCLFVLFDNLPLVDLLQIDQVCTRWSALKNAACARRQQLTILLGRPKTDLIVNSTFNEPSQEYRDHSNGDDDQYAMKLMEKSLVQYDWLNQDSADFIVDSFPGITNLNVSIHNIPTTSLLKVINLLEHYQPQLVSLKLRCKFMGKEPGEQVEARFVRLFASMNSLVNLKHLTLELYHFLNIPRIDLFALSYLNEFNFSIIDRADVLVDSLRDYADKNLALRRIGLLCPISDRICLHQLYQLENCDKFTHLRVEYVWPEAAELKQFCCTFTSLTYVHLDIGSLTLVQLTNSLKSLTSLIKLSMSIDFLETHQTFALENQIPSSEFTQLPSIKHLELSLLLSNHTQLQSNHFGHIFPSIESLNIAYNYMECSICGYDTFDSLDEVQKVECVRGLVQDWQEQCSGSLKRLVTVSAFRNDSVVWQIGQ